MKQIPYVNLSDQQQEVRKEIQHAVAEVIASGQYILGKTVASFEREFAAYCGTRYAIGVGSGTDALILSLKSLGIGPGDEVITTPNSFLASASCVSLVGATPVFIDVRQDFNMDPDLIEPAITDRTRAIIAVHLTGRPADMTPIMKTARRHGLHVLEDAAQAVGANYRGKRAGSFGTTGCFSFHPLKNLNACGDGGMITTDDDNIYKYLLQARNHGLVDRDTCEFFSGNSRLDALQAAILRVKLRHVDTWNDQRREHAAFYREQLRDIVEVPVEASHEHCVWQTFMVQSTQRDRLKTFLTVHGIETKIHYPVPIHLQPAASTLGYRAGDFPMAEMQSGTILSLPIYPELTQSQLSSVTKAIRSFAES